MSPTHDGPMTNILSITLNLLLEAHTLPNDKGYRNKGKYMYPFLLWANTRVDAHPILGHPVVGTIKEALAVLWLAHVVCKLVYWIVLATGYPPADSDNNS